MAPPRDAHQPSIEPNIIRIRGAREQNLRGIDLDLPLRCWIAVVGPSGSGKTSLVFETLVREGERRFLGSLTPRARQFFGKLGRSDVDSMEGLPATIAVGQQTATSHSRSTVGTLTGTLDLLRLLFAREARLGREAEGFTPSTHLTRSHFSFNHPLGQCPKCRGLGEEDRVDPAKIVADPSKSIRGGALVPTLKNGYTVYSQVTLDVMNQICRTHGFDVDTPWVDLKEEQRRVIFYGSRALKVPFGKHSIESRMKWEGITARPREEGYYLGLVPVIEETLKRNRNENILRFVSSVPCTECWGSRLALPGRSACFGTFTLPELLALSVRDWPDAIEQFPPSQVWKTLQPGFCERITRLDRLGLGHLSLNRTSPTLSGGEGQRVRLAAQLGAGLRGVLFALDEPTLGLHPESQMGMRAVLDELVENGNSLVVVEHDPDMVRHADHVVALGPGAGSLGGTVVETDIAGHPQSTSRSDHPLGAGVNPKPQQREGIGSLSLTGATLYNLENADIHLTLGVLNVVIGPSGAGKSSLVFGTLLPAILGEPGGPFSTLEYFRANGSNGESDPESASSSQKALARQSRQYANAVDARPIGKTPRSTPATWSGLFDGIRKRFASLPGAKAEKLTASHFSFNSKQGRCPACEGLGVTRLGLHLFRDVESPCTSCEGSRYAADTLAVRLHGKTIADVLTLTFADAADFFADEPSLFRMCEAMNTLGMGYLTLGQSSATLSRGESQRVKLATLLGSKKKERSLVLLDEPDRGLSPSDVQFLVRALDALVEQGHTLVAISHHRHVWAAADRLIEVRNGRTHHNPILDWDPLSERRPTRVSSQALDRPIEFTGVRTNNLKGVNVHFPIHKFTVVCGVSGSGKSSLVFDTLAAEGERRFAESLPFQVRRYLRRLPQPRYESATGITPTLNLRQLGPPSGARSTVATQSECGPILRLIFSRAGTRNGAPCQLSASHFSPDTSFGACSECSGRGAQHTCDPARLTTHPELPLLSPVASSSRKSTTAMGGTRPGRFFTEHDGQYMATLETALVAKGLIGSKVSAADLLMETPWSNLASEIQEMALRGSGSDEHQVEWTFASRAEGSGQHQFQSQWVGLCALVEQEAKSRGRSKKAAEWSYPIGNTMCKRCHGSGLTDLARETTVFEHGLVDLQTLPLHEVVPALTPAGSAPHVVLDSLLPELRERIGELLALGLGHLSLDRPVSTLSRGELQRVRIASVFRAGLSGTTLTLDEPTAGLHERDVGGLLDRILQFQMEGNTVVVVSHRASVIARADHVIALGPGAGDRGGRLVSPTELGAPGILASAGAEIISTSERIRVSGARAHNLKNIDVSFPASGFVCITGVSGSGKSSLLFDVIGETFQQGRPVDCDAIETPQKKSPFNEIYDARRIGLGQTALTAIGIQTEIAKLFVHETLPTRAFKSGDAAGRCPACAGRGEERVAMDFLADLHLPCEACNGMGFHPEVLDVQWRGMNIAELLAAPASMVLSELESGEDNIDPATRSDTKPRKGGLPLEGQHLVIESLQTLESVAVGHIPLGRSRRELSGGESARIGLAAALLQSSAPSLLLFDEPSTGLHELDLAKVVAAFRRLGETGSLVLATEHRLSAIASADWVVDLGPEGGPNGGRLVEAGTPGSLSVGHTANALGTLL